MTRDPESPPRSTSHRSPISCIPRVCLTVLAFFPWNVTLAADDRVGNPAPRSPSAPRDADELKGLDNTPEGGTLPGGPVPGGTVPGGTVPGGTVPGGTVPGGTLPGGTVPGGTVPGGTAPGGTLPGGPVPGGPVPGGTLP